MKYTLISYEYITKETKTIENPTIDDLIKELSKAGCVNVNIFDENHNVVFNDYHEKTSNNIYQFCSTTITRK